MYNYQKQLKNQKQKTFQQIKETYNYLFFCKYYDLKSHEIIKLKFFLKKNQIQFKIIKHKLLNKNYKLNGQGSVLIIFFNDYDNLKILTSFFENNLKIEPLFLTYNKTKISILKLKKIYKNPIPLPYQLKTSIFNLYQIFSNIKNQ